MLMAGDMLSRTIAELSGLPMRRVLEILGVRRGYRAGGLRGQPSST
jgi:hypothetical protein